MTTQPHPDEAILKEYRQSRWYEMLKDHKNYDESGDEGYLFACWLEHALSTVRSEAVKEERENIRQNFNNIPKVPLKNQKGEVIEYMVNAKAVERVIEDECYPHCHCHHSKEQRYCTANLTTCRHCLPTPKGEIKVK